jgi:hypothetical protein
MRDDSPAEVHLSIPQVTICVSLVVALLFWCCAASAYADRDGHRFQQPARRARGAAISFFVQVAGRFAWQSVAQIPSAPWVIGYVVSERRGLLIGGLIVEAMVITGGMGLQMLESRIELPRKKKRKRRKIAMPSAEPE